MIATGGEGNVCVFAACRCLEKLAVYSKILIVR